MNFLSLYTTSYGKDGLFCAFSNGSVGVFNYHKKKLEYLSQPNHSETIFDIVFKPNDKNKMASVSYDGVIKIWNTDGMECKMTLTKPNQKTTMHVREFSTIRKFIAYGVSWHPGKEHRIVSVNANGEVLLWDTEKAKLLHEITPGTNSPIYRVDWNPLNPKLIATGSSDYFAYATVICHSP